MKKRLSKKTYVKRISAVLIAVLFICALPAERSYGLLSPLSQVGAPAKVTTFKSTAEDAAGLKYTNSGVLNKNMEICVKDGQVKILRYMDVINYNRQTIEIGGLYDTSLYLDNSLEDIRFVLRNPATGVYSSITAAKQSYIRSVASRITAGITMDYEKLRAIYEYTAGNFYYDSVAFQTHNNQYCDPYENIFSFETGRTGINSQNGRVYTTCQGYSAIFIALARAQGIPARLVSTQTVRHFTPTAASYEICFTPDPDSYKYTLYPGDASAAKLPYIQAAAKRMAALGYYTPPAGTSPGEETSYSAAMAEAAKKFQVMTDLKNTGNIASLTWKALFSEDAPGMVSDAKFEGILVEYQARKAAQAEAESIMNTVSLKASSEAGKGYIRVSWTCSAAGYVDGYEIWKSTARTGGYKKMFTTSNQTYKNTAGLKKGTRYYYKVRAYKEVGGKKICSGWSNPAYRIAK